MNDDPDSGVVIRAVVSKADIPRVGGSRVEIVREADEPPIELHQSLDLTITGSRTENWTVGPAVIIEATAEIINSRQNFMSGLMVFQCPIAGLWKSDLVQIFRL